jgi:glycosyltransferase involved in cell wall biosynthesis
MPRQAFVDLLITDKPCGRQIRADGLKDLLALRAICQETYAALEIAKLLKGLEDEQARQQGQIERQRELEQGKQLSELELQELQELQELPEPVDPSPVLAMLQITAREARAEALQDRDMAIHLVVEEPSGAATQASFLVFDGRARAEQGFHDVGHRWRRADHEKGVAYLCPWEDPFGGFPEHSRRCARALSMTGMPVHMQSIDPVQQVHVPSSPAGKAMRGMQDQYQDLLGTSLRHVLVEVHQLVPEEEYLHRLLVHPEIDAQQLAVINRHRIVYTVWERDRVPEHVVRCLNQMGQCWVANPHDVDMLAGCGVPRDKLRVVPIPFRDDDPHLAFKGRKRIPGPPRLYHIGKWEPRKNHHDMIGAFLLAFLPGEARFFLKTSETAPSLGDYPQTPEISVNRWLEMQRIKDRGWDHESFNRDVFIYREHVTEEQLLEMHRMGDIYLSLSRGEGFDMPAFDAKLSGNLMVYTPSGGPQSFAGDQDVLVEPIGKIDCHPFYRWKGARYLDYQVDDAAEGMREAVRRVRRRIRGDVDLRSFSMAAVGQRMRSYIEQTLETAREGVTAISSPMSS